MAYQTKQKNEIVSFFEAHSDKSFTPDQVFDGVSDSGIGKSTVYRITASLAEAGILRRERDGGGGKYTYQLIKCGDCHEHLHLKCRECGKLVHLDEKLSHALGASLKSNAGFSLDESTLLYGRCESCQNSEN